MGNVKQARNTFNFALNSEPESIGATFNIPRLNLREGDLRLVNDVFSMC